MSVYAYCQAPKIHRAGLTEILGRIDRSRPMIIAGDFNESERKEGCSG